MTSAIDTTKPVGPIAYTADVRANFATAKSEISALQTALPFYLPLIGGVMAGRLTLFDDPSGPLDAATRQYVDGAVSHATGSSPVIATGSTNPRTIADRAADWVNVADFWSPGRVAGTTDDLPAWNAALTRAVAMGGATITAPTGTVSRITGAITCNTSGIRFYLPNVTIKLSGSSITSAFNFTGGSTGGPTLSVDAPAFATTITVSALNGTVAGGYIGLERAAPSNGGAPGNYSFIALVRSISGTGPYTLVLDSPLPCSFSVNDQSLVTLNYTPLMTDVGISGGVTLDGTAATGPTVHGIYALKCMRSTFRDIEANNFTAGSGIYTFRGHNNLYENIISLNSGTASAAAVHLNNQTASHINNVRVLQAAGFSMDLTAWNYCTGTGIICEGAVAGRGFKLQASLYCTMSNIQGHLNAYTGIAIAIGSVGNKLSGLSAHSNQYHNGLWISDQFNTGNTIFGIDAHGNTGDDLTIGVTDTGNTIIGANVDSIQDNAPDTIWIASDRVVFHGTATVGSPANNNALRITPGAGPTNSVVFDRTGTGIFLLNGPTTIASTLNASGNIVATAANVVGQNGVTAGTAAGATGTVTIQGAVATSRQIVFNTGALSRWAIRANPTAEGGSNAGTDLDFLTFNDAGGSSPTVMRIIRASGNLLLGPTADAGFKLDVTGSARVNDLTVTNSILLTGGATVTGLTTTANFIVGLAGTNNTLTINPGAAPANTISFGESGTGGFFFGGPVISGGAITANGGNVVATAAQVVGQTGVTAGTAAGAGAAVTIQGAVATSRQIVFNTGALSRWVIRANPTAEGGSNAGTDLDILAASDGGVVSGLPTLRLTRSNNNAAFAGSVGFNGTAPTAKPSITGSRGGNAALADLLTKLAATGLIADTTTA